MGKSAASWAATWFYFFLAGTLTVYILRGLTILSMIPGSVIWGLLLLTIATGLLAALHRLR